jgi:hypothetical protein
LENTDGNVGNHRAWESITENIKILDKDNLGYYELKLYETWRDEECSKYYMKGRD